MYYLVHTNAHGYEYEMFPMRYQAEDYRDSLRKHLAYRNIIIEVHAIAHDDLYEAAVQ